MGGLARLSFTQHLELQAEKCRYSIACITVFFNVSCSKREIGTRKQTGMEFPKKCKKNQIRIHGF